MYDTFFDDVSLNDRHKDLTSLNYHDITIGSIAFIYRIDKCYIPKQEFLLFFACSSINHDGYLILKTTNTNIPIYSLRRALFE